MSTVQDTDLLLINRAGVDYHCTFADWKASQVSVAKPRIITPAAGAVDLGETPTFTSSAFSATGAVTHVSSDWQVTLKTDTAFASPVVQSMADATNKVSWAGGPLQPNTDYIARVRHNGSGGVQSPWSDAVGFKTKSAFVITMAPSDLFEVDDTAARLITGGPKMVQVASNAKTRNLAFGLGVDGLIYYLSSASASWVEMTTALLGTNTWFPPSTDFTKQAVQFFTSDGNTGVIIYADGTNFFYKDDSVLTGPSLGVGEKILGGGPVCIASSHMYLLTNQTILLSPAYDSRGVNSSLTDDGSDLSTAGSFGKSTVTLPAGVRASTVHSLTYNGSLVLESLAIQASDGYYYTCGKDAVWTGATVSAIGTRAAPTLFTINGSKVKYYVACLGGGKGYAHTGDGKWYSLDSQSYAIQAITTLDATIAELYTNWGIKPAGWAKRTDGTWCYSTNLDAVAPTPMATQPTLKGGTWAIDLYLIGRINLLPGA